MAPGVRLSQDQSCLMFHPSRLWGTAWLSSGPLSPSGGFSGNLMTKGFRSDTFQGHHPTLSETQLVLKQ